MTAAEKKAAAKAKAEQDAAEAAEIAAQLAAKERAERDAEQDAAKIGSGDESSPKPKADDSSAFPKSPFTAPNYYTPPPPVL